MRFNHRLVAGPKPRPLASLVRAFVVFHFLVAIVATSADDVLIEKPLAKSAVQIINAQNNNYEMTPNVAINGYRTPQTDILANYARGFDGQWQIPQQVDRANPWVRVLVLAPERPLLVDMAIYVDGEPFTAAREKLIDKLMEDASVESLVRDAVSVPIPEETEEKSQPEPGSEGKDSKQEDSESEEPASQSETLAEDSDEKNDSTKKADEKKTEKKEPEKPMVEVKRREARTVAQRLVNYMASAEVEADREEVRWLLAEWTGGPALLALGPAVSWQRVGFAPLWNALDADGSDSLSEAEIAAAAERLSQADVDENSIVELEELSAIKPHQTTAPRGYPLVVILDHQTNWRQLNSHLRAAYGRRASNQQGQVASTTSTLLHRVANGESSFAAGELAGLVDEPADVRLRISLGSKDQESGIQNELALLSANSKEYVESDKMVTLVMGAEYLEFSAGELKEKEASEPIATQVSIGAVVDGYPLFRLVDRNGDRRLSPRERRNVKNVLAGLDLDGDGQISEREKPTAIRIAISRGPHVHEMLAEPTSAKREFASAGENETGSPEKDPGIEVPSWFTDMDRNRDGDVSRSEFLGTSEQFRELDRDGDGLVGSREATN